MTIDQAPSHTEAQSTRPERVIEFLRTTPEQSIQPRETMVNRLSGNPVGRYAIDAYVIDTSGDEEIVVRHQTLTETDLIGVRNKLVADASETPDDRKMELLDLLIKANTLQAAGEEAVRSAQ